MADRTGLYTLTEIAESVGIPRTKVQYYIRTRKIEPEKLAGTTLLYSATAKNAVRRVHREVQKQIVKRARKVAR